MSLVAGLLAGLGILLWPDSFGRLRLVILDRVSTAQVPVARSAPESARDRARRVLSSRAPLGQAFSGNGLPGRSAVSVSAPDLLGLLEAVAPALEAGLAPAEALRIAADALSGTGRADPLAALARDLAFAAADGASLAHRWHEAAESAGSAELLLLAQAWSLTEEMGVPLAQAVRTTAGLLEARIAHERRLAGAVAGARATVNVLTVLPVGGPLLALVLGIGPADLYGGSRLTQASLLLGIALAGFGRWWVRRMVRAVARGPVVR